MVRLCTMRGRRDHDDQQAHQQILLQDPEMFESLLCRRTNLVLCTTTAQRDCGQYNEPDVTNVLSNFSTHMDVYGDMSTPAAYVGSL